MLVRCFWEDGRLGDAREELLSLMKTVLRYVFVGWIEESDIRVQSRVYIAGKSDFNAQ